MNRQAIMRRLRAMADPGQLEGMARFGINTEHALGGITVADLRKLAREIGREHDLALELWETGVHEARILASMVDEPALVTETQMEAWVADFDSWDLCDQVCGNLFDRTPFAFPKAVEWSSRREEFVKRAAFAILAWSASHNKEAADRDFEAFLPIIRREATDERNFVRKAVNWALRQIGKRNARLNAKAIGTAERIAKLDSKAARWIARDALRELRKPQTQSRVRAGC